jgi:hypothetical protein
MTKLMHEIRHADDLNGAVDLEQVAELIAPHAAR